MDNLSNCKLCGAAPIEIQTFECVKHMCPSKNCTLNHVLLRPEQWQALMGEDRDAVRYRWLREKARTGEDAPDGLYIGVDSVKYPGKWALYEKHADKAIDAAMKEQVND